ncbi:MAG: Fe-S cluster assembly protein SufD [Gammaproteobacteria bacterium RIFCSPHIGHO2_12_FULL_37_34]|nr:MAG: Fe-S cluster assembly protein SufD [Gammaproteobacteria bacterium RIFCSPHIGHO2_12_FULL_37_34]
MTAIHIPSWLNQHFSNVEPAAEPQWLADFRKHHRDNFLKTGLPSRRQERWKYTNLACLENKKFIVAKPFTTIEKNWYEKTKACRAASFENHFVVCVNGFYAPSLSQLEKLPTGIIICSLQTAIHQYPELVKKHWPQQQFDIDHYPFANLNAAFAHDGLFLYVSDHCKIDLPIHIVSITTDHYESVTHPHHILVLGKFSKLCILEEHVAWSDRASLMNIVTTISVSAGADLEYYKHQQSNRHAICFAHTVIEQQEDSLVNHVDCSAGSFFIRDDLLIKLNKRGASCSTSSFYRLYQDGQYVDHHVDIEHRAPYVRSDMLYKGIIDKKSQAVFKGKLYVAPEAKKTCAYQANHHLLLANQAEAYSRPELEIYADDVQCKHGATTGKLDQEALFYLRSRGIHYDDALHILLQGFAYDVMQRIRHEGIRDYIQHHRMVE